MVIASNYDLTIGTIKRESLKMVLRACSPTVTWPQALHCKAFLRARQHEPQPLSRREALRGRARVAPAYRRRRPNFV
jgi:hypothetical protein